MTTLEEMIWPDGAVRLADSAFPVDVTRSDAPDLDTFVKHEQRIALAAMPDGGYALAIFDKLGGGELVLVERVTEIEMFRASQRVMVLESGVKVAYVPSIHCGCGSRLRGFKPWGTRRLVGVPKPKPTVPEPLAY